MTINNFSLSSKLSNDELESLYDLVRDKVDIVMHGDWLAVKDEVADLHFLMYKLLKAQKS